MMAFLKHIKICQGKQPLLWKEPLLLQEWELDQDVNFFPSPTTNRHVNDPKDARHPLKVRKTPAEAAKVSNSSPSYFWASSASSFWVLSTFSSSQTRSPSSTIRTGR